MTSPPVSRLILSETPAETAGHRRVGQTGGLSNFGYGLGVNRCNCPLMEQEDQFQFVNNWTKIMGNHQIKFGGDIRYARNLRVPSDNHRAGELTFAKTFTSLNWPPQRPQRRLGDCYFPAR